MGFTKCGHRTLRNPNTCPNCGQVIGYWGHDRTDVGEVRDAEHCKRHNSYSWVYLERSAPGRDGADVDYRHVHYCAGESSPRKYIGDPKLANLADGQDDGQDGQEIPEPKVPDIKAPEVKPEDGAMGALKALVLSWVAEMVAAIVSSKIAEMFTSLRADLTMMTAKTVKDILGDMGMLPTRVEIKHANGEVRKVEGLAHFVLPTIIKLLDGGDHVYMVGPAGTGKSHIGQQAAKALDMVFYALSVGPMMTEAKLLGYMDANGKFVETAFYRWCKFGGVYLFDEVDNGNPAVLNVLNSALSNGFVLFPNGEMVYLHETCLCIAAANTYGTGQENLKGYVRAKLDVAFLDRFVFVEVPIDLALERALVLSKVNLSEARVDKSLAYVRHLRENALKANMPVVIGPRSAVRFAKLLDRGFTHEQAVKMGIRGGISDANWETLIKGAPYLAGI